MAIRRRTPRLTAEQVLEQERILLAGSAQAAFEFARSTPGANVPALQGRVLAHGDAWFAYQFARYAPKADIAACQDCVLAVGDGWLAYRFAMHVPKADTAACQARILAMGAGLDATFFAADVPDADVPALQQRVLMVGNGLNMYMFVRDVSTADVEALYARAQALASMAWWTSSSVQILISVWLSTVPSASCWLASPMWWLTLALGQWLRPPKFRHFFVNLNNQRHHEQSKSTCPCASNGFCAGAPNRVCI